MSTETQTSWRDPSGFVLRSQGRILRAVRPEAADLLRRLFDSPWYQARVSVGSFPNSQWLSELPDHPQASQYVWIEHQALHFPCYPHELTAQQLYAAARFTLDIAREALEHGWLLKDASAWNVLFDHGKPVFCDVLSFEPCNKSGVWLAYAQFCRHFIIPLLLHRNLGLQPAEMFINHHDGITPERAWPMLKGLRAWRQPAISAVTLPYLLARKGKAALASAVAHPPSTDNQELAKYLLVRTFSRMEKQLERLKPTPQRSHRGWADYEHNRDHYSVADLYAKSAFVRQALQALPGTTMLDIGCNAGEFSYLAAEQGRIVVAADFDADALGLLWEELQRRPAQINPMLVNIAYPPPAIGWMNREVTSFLDRAKGKFDCVLALGLIHHLLVSERIPLSEVLNLMVNQAPSSLIIEWIEPNDPRFSSLAGFNSVEYENLSEDNFEAVFGCHFHLLEKMRLPSCNTRILYHWQRLTQTT